MSSKIYPVVLCGGSGTRLWPSSRKAFPKQFSPLLKGDSLFQQTLRRLNAPGMEPPVILTNDEFRFMARDQATEIGLSDARIVLEPVGRDTAPAILTAALLLEAEPDAMMLVAPSDHLIADAARFLEAVRAGADAAADGQLVTFGVTPDKAETGYGYLELGEIPGNGRPAALTRFVEKPDLASAEDMVRSGRFLWNAGIFLFRVADILAAFERHAPQMLEPCREAVRLGRDDLGFLRLDPDAYGAVDGNSIDFQIMEKADNISVVPIDVGWSDLGSWSSLFDALTEDRDGVVQDGPVTAIDCSRSLLRSEDDGVHLVGLGLKDTVAVAMRDAVLVAGIEHAQKVREVVDALRAAQIAQADDYPRFFRPWGWYESLCVGSRFQVKRIMVSPGGILSLQSHVHRSEHWVVVEGTARVTIGDEVKLVSENESVYIPLGTMHRLENPGKLPMYLIEVQTGSYLGEDDIRRYEDVYDRG